MSFRRKIGAGFRFLRSRFTANSGILLYHRVAEPVRDPFRLCVSPAHFEEQIASIREFGTPISIGEFIRRQRDGSLEEHSLSLSFDDGYVDFLKNAVPVLEKFEIPAVIYCVSGHLGRPFWWDQLLSSLHEPDSLPPTIELETAESTIAMETAQRTRDELFERLYPFFRNLAPVERDSAQAGLDEIVGFSGKSTSRRLMTAEELRTLATHPLITIGAHTVSHTSLATLSPDDQFKEIEGSLNQLSGIIESPVTTFSYPFGIRVRDFDGLTIEAARTAGLDHALAADLGVVTAKADPFALPRIWIHDTGAAGFSRKLKGWL